MHKRSQDYSFEMDKSKDLIKNFKCEICERSYSTNNSKSQHILDIHGEANEFVCNVCDANSRNLQNHIKANHDRKSKHKCDSCGKFFPQAGTLRKHMLIHEGQRNHKCDTCGKSFTRVGTLKTHMATHEGQRNFKCGSCGKSFTQSGTLNSHIKAIHEGLKAHKCDICEESFSSSCYLKVTSC